MEVKVKTLSPGRAQLLAISVIGGSSATDEILAAAEETGHLIGEAGAALVCGGRYGIMAAACRGAKSAGGLTVGILPGGDASEANEWVDIAIPTGMGFARNILVVKSGCAVIAFPGDFGTLSEIAHAGNEGVPVVGLGTWELYKDGQAETRIARASTPRDAVEMALALARPNVPGVPLADEEE